MEKLSITLSQAIDGFFIEKRAQQRSPHTLTDYANAFRRLREFLDGDPLLGEISALQIDAFLIDLGEKPVASRGIAPRKARTLSKKSILNIHTALSSLWSWAVDEGYAEVHVMQSVPRPDPEQRAIVPYSREDVRRMLEQCDRSSEYVWRETHTMTQRRPTRLRDQAIVRLLLDTGIRASELCRLTIGDLDLVNQRIKVFGKGSKERYVPFGRRTGKAVWRYLTTRPGKTSDEPVFVAYGEVDMPMSRKALYLVIRTLGDRAGIVPKAGVHRFRHTFAITLLRNGGNVYALQEMLGHTSLEMVRRYLQIAQADVDDAHRRASPVDRWRL